MKNDSKIMLIGISTVIILLGIPVAFADFYEETIKIPIPDHITGQDVKKQMTELTDNVLEYTITYRFYLGQNGTQWFIDELTSTPIMKPADMTECPDGLYLALDGVSCLPHPEESGIVIEDKPKDLTKFEEKLEYYEANPPKTYDQQDEQRKLQELEECFEGLAQSRGIQSYGSFYTSEYDEVQSVPKTGEASPLDIAIERCHAEAILLPILGDERKEGDVKSRQAYFGYVETPHSERAIIDEEYWAIVPTQPDQKSIHDLKDAEAEAHDIICNSDRVTIQFKRQQVPPCTAEQLGIKGDFEEWNNTGIGTGKPTWYRSESNLTTEGGGEIPVNGWNMTPEAEWTEEQQVKCSGRDMQFPTAYERAICGTTGT